jgi:hypothetical protein
LMPLFPGSPLNTRKISSSCGCINDDTKNRTTAKGLWKEGKANSPRHLSCQSDQSFLWNLSHPISS